MRWTYWPATTCDRRYRQFPDALPGEQCVCAARAGRTCTDRFCASMDSSPFSMRSVARVTAASSASRRRPDSCRIARKAVCLACFRASSARWSGARGDEVDPRAARCPGGQAVTIRCADVPLARNELRKHPQCPVCGPDPSITGLIDYDEFCGVKTNVQNDQAERSRKLQSRS